MSNQDPDTNRAYMRKYMLARYHRRMAEARRALGNKCALCGSKRLLQIDHIDRTTKAFTLGGAAAGISQSRWDAELAKCQLLCHDCHNKKTVQERGFQLAKGRHGTISSYRYCRCDLCRKAKSDYQRGRKRTARKHAPVA